MGSSPMASLGGAAGAEQLAAAVDSVPVPPPPMLVPTPVPQAPSRRERGRPLGAKCRACSRRGKPCGTSCPDWPGLSASELASTPAPIEMAATAGPTTASAPVATPSEVGTSGAATVGPAAGSMTEQTRRPPAPRNLDALAPEWSGRVRVGHDPGGATQPADALRDERRDVPAPRGGGEAARRRLVGMYVRLRQFGFSTLSTRAVNLQAYINTS
jgi:hypothetical protein